MRNAVDEVAPAPRSFPRIPITDVRNLPENDPLVFEPGLLVQGCSHQLVAPYQSGKTFLALICGKELMETGLRVLYLDYENRPRSIRERLEVVGANKECWDYLSYGNCPNLDLTEESQREWSEYLGYLEPELIIFDSLNGFLSNAGRDENSSTGFQEWANVYLKVPRALGITTLVLDHTGWDTSHSRGTSRKPDEFDIVWKVGVKRRFSRRDTGQLKLKLLKDRDSLVDRDGFDIVIGGEPFQFQVEAADSTKNDLSSGQEKTFALVTQNSNNHMGTPRKSINELFNGSKSRADKNIKSLVKMDLIYQPEGSTDYWIVDPVSYSSSESPEDSDPNSASDPSVDMASGEGVPGSRSFRSGPQDPAHQTTPHGSVRMGDFDNRSDVDGGGIKTEGESVSRIENHADATLIVKTKDILEAIEHLNYNQRRIQILKSVASVLLAHPMLPATTKKERLDDDIAKILRLVEKEGVKINRKAFITALQVLEDEFSFLKVLEEKVRWLVNGKSSCDFDEEWAS